MTQAEQQSIVLPKTHVHIILMQLNIREGLKAYGFKGYEAILKEVRQLHTQQALMPHREMKCHMRRGEKC